MSLVKNLRKSLDDFSIDVIEWPLVDEGITLLWGPSGSGKTSIVRLLTGLEESALEWWFEQENIARLKPCDRRISVVFQHLSLFPHLTAEENILFPLRAQKIPSASYAGDWESIVQLLEIGPFLNKKCRLLSGGEKQRVALARALITRPRWLILDEPFTALDIHLRKQARFLLRKIVSERQIPVLLVSHDPTDAEQLADRVVTLSQGRIQKVESTEQFMKTLPL